MNRFGDTKIIDELEMINNMNSFDFNKPINSHELIIYHYRMIMDLLIDELKNNINCDEICILDDDVREYSNHNDRVQDKNIEECLNIILVNQINIGYQKIQNRLLLILNLDNICINHLNHKIYHYNPEREIILNSRHYNIRLITFSCNNYKFLPPEFRLNFNYIMIFYTNCVETKKFIHKKYAHHFRNYHDFENFFDQFQNTNYVYVKNEYTSYYNHINEYYNLSPVLRRQKRFKITKNARK